MPAGARELWINFTRLQMSFASEAAEKKAVSEELVDRKSDFRSEERCFVTARSDGTAGNGTASEGTRRNHTILIMRGRSSSG
jgi:hypothetical protein